MTREKCSELLPLFIAFAHGAHVEYLNHQGEWVTSDSIGFGTTGIDRYRVNGKQYEAYSTSVAIDVIVGVLKDKFSGVDMGAMLERVKSRLK
jgi:hypothetical protein